MNFELWHDPGLKGGDTVSLLHSHVLLDDAVMAWQILPDLDTDRLLGYLVPGLDYFSRMICKVMGFLKALLPVDVVVFVDPAGDDVVPGHVFVRRVGDGEVHR